MSQDQQQRLEVATMTGYSFAVIRGIHEGLNYKNVKD